MLPGLNLVRGWNWQSGKPTGSERLTTREASLVTTGHSCVKWAKKYIRLRTRQRNERKLVVIALINTTRGVSHRADTYSE